MRVYVFIEKVFYDVNGVLHLQRCSVEVFGKLGDAIAHRCNVRNFYMNGVPGLTEDFGRYAVILSRPGDRIVLQIEEKDLL